MRFNRYILLVLFWCSLATSAVADTSALKVAYLFNFLIYTQWPETQKSYDICMSNKEPLFDEASKLTLKNINGHSVRLIAIIDNDVLPENCSVFFFSKVSLPHLERWLIERPPIGLLVVSEKTHLLSRHAIFRFFETEDRLMFELSISNIMSSHLVINQKLVRLAAAVY